MQKVLLARGESAPTLQTPHLAWEAVHRDNERGSTSVYSVLDFAMLRRHGRRCRRLANVEMVGEEKSKI